MDAMGEDASMEKIHTSTMAYIEHPFPEFWVSQKLLPAVLLQAEEMRFFKRKKPPTGIGKYNEHRWI